LRIPGRAVERRREQRLLQVAAVDRGGERTGGIEGRESLA